MATRVVDPKAPVRTWPDYAALWRWHFYAGLLCLPFFCWLAITGSLYLFRPDIEAWLDRPYENLQLSAARALPSAEAEAAVRAVPGSTFSRYEPPATPTGAAQVVVAQGGHLFRVYVHPTSLTPLKVGRDDHRPMELISHLHGQLLMGTPGSVVVEMAGSWGVIMIVTGLCLWFPRSSWRLAGVVYPRLSKGGRMFWRDLHAVTGLWICTVTLFLLLSGLPWASSWGNYFTWLRNQWSVTAGAPDWSLGGKDEPLPTLATTRKAAADATQAHITSAEMAAMMPEHAQHAMTMGGHMMVMPAPSLRALDVVVPALLHLSVPRPLWVLPPSDGGHDWVVSSRIQDRPRRVSYAIDPATGAVTGRKGFDNDNVVNRAINVAIATHEGHLFGRPNQAILLANALGVLLVTMSAAVMWWRRRPAHTLGAPKRAVRPRWPSMLALACAIVMLTVMLPLFGASLVVVLLLEQLALPRWPAAQRWLGLESSPLERRQA